MSAAVSELAELLGVPAGRLSMLTGYDDSQLAVLVSGIRTAMAEEDEAVQRGFTDALRFVPRPLRGAATRILFPGGASDV